MTVGYSRTGLFPQQKGMSIHHGNRYVIIREAGGPFGIATAQLEPGRRHRLGMANGLSRARFHLVALFPVYRQLG